MSIFYSSKNDNEHSTIYSHYSKIQFIYLTPWSFIALFVILWIIVFSISSASNHILDYLAISNPNFMPKGYYSIILVHIFTWSTMKVLQDRRWVQTVISVAYHKNYCSLQFWSRRNKYHDINFWGIIPRLQQSKEGYKCRNSKQYVKTKISTFEMSHLGEKFKYFQD